MPMVYATEQNVRKNLKDASYCEEFSYELELLCGAKVFYDYLLSKASSTESSDVSVKIGGITQKQSSKLSENVSYAKELYTKYKLLSTNLFVDNEFMFGSV